MDLTCHARRRFQKTSNKLKTSDSQVQQITLVLNRVTLSIQHSPSRETPPAVSCRQVPPGQGSKGKARQAYSQPPAVNAMNIGKRAKRNRSGLHQEEISRTKQILGQHLNVIGTQKNWKAKTHQILQSSIQGQKDWDLYQSGEASRQGIDVGCLEELREELILSLFVLCG